MIINFKNRLMGLCVVAVFSYAANAAMPKECVVALSGLEDRFNEELAKDHGDPVNDALALLDTSKQCANTSEEKALVADLYGEAFHLGYVYSGDAKLFDYSVKSFNKGINFNTTRNEKIYWHMARLMRSAKRYPEAIQYLNKVLNMTPEPKNPLPYLETGFQLAVDAMQWNDAKGLMEELSRRDKRFYANPDLLLSSVITLCHFNQLSDAKIIIKNVEEHVNLNEDDKRLVQRSKDVVKDCEEQNKR